MLCQRLPISAISRYIVGDDYMALVGNFAARDIGRRRDVRKTQSSAIEARGVGQESRFASDALWHTGKQNQANKRETRRTRK